jgi:pSer/pThr/pTyr-binding forkhead associated (FHA) protein
MSNSSSNPNRSLAVQLVDTASGRIVQVWEFEDRDTISIGRAPERDVTIADPYVSRHHAELRRRDGQWTLVALGRHGVLVGGKDIAEAPVGDGTAFRLGGSGPLLRFYCSPLSEQELTLSGGHDPGELLPQINAGKRDEEVRGIVETDYFQKLQQRARDMRQQRGSS